MITFETCTGDCGGTGRAINHFPTVALGDDGAPILGKHAPVDVDHHEIITCPTCQGIRGTDGRTRARYRDQYDTYGQAYKSASSLKAAVTRGKASICRTCTGRGSAARLNMITPCWTCSGAGRVVSSFSPGDILPAEVDLYDHAQGAQEWARSVPLIIVREADAVLSWGAAMLGIGTMWTSTDYGRMAASDDATAAATVRESLSSSGQWIKFVDRETRAIASAVVVTITSNGYAVTTTASLDGAARVMLPPTYTAEVLNAPYGR